MYSWAVPTAKQTKVPCFFSTDTPFFTTVVAGDVDTSALAKLTLLRSGSGFGGFRARRGGLARSGHAGAAWGWMWMAVDGLGMNVDAF